MEPIVSIIMGSTSDLPVMEKTADILKKIPELMGGIGKGMKDFKKAIKSDDDDIKSPQETITTTNKKEAPKE